ncbi:MAG TPA: di-heme oxidoredictase family protein [Rhizomicrobium sp.]|nr:di-heme oxidoredictase family protein [Rhizomicrobium sp.]
MVSRFLTALALLSLLSAAAPLPGASPGKAAVDVAAGWSLFRRPWISSPSSLLAGGGVGPLYNSRACDSCHVGGGPGSVAEDAIGSGMVVRTGRASPTGDPVYGWQIQTRALPGFDPEADVAFHWATHGSLRAASIDFAHMYYGSLSDGSHAALRRAPSLLGVGTLESIPDSEIVSRAGSGRPAWILGAAGERELGRFGWKASEPKLTMQIDSAFQRDFGIGTSDFPGAYGECTAAEKACRAVGGPDVELPDGLRDLIADYLRSLIPLTLNEGSPGFAMFRKAGCMMCHATLRDAKGKPVHAYTDLRLHDMGPELDDGIAEGAARPSEWRTAPLWAVAESLSRGGLLHDGRARSVDEAVQWHGGEASQARAAFNALSPKDRKLVSDFLLGR